MRGELDGTIFREQEEEEREEKSERERGEERERERETKWDFRAEMAANLCGAKSLKI